MIQTLDAMHPNIRSAAENFIFEAQLQGIFLRITSGYRTFQEQEQLYSQGRTTSGNIVTNARGGQSNHNYGLAFDVVEIKNGVALWNNDWETIAEIGKSNGFEWGGDWSSFPDRPHFEMFFGNTIDTLLNKYNNKEVDKEGYVIID